jgi:hypothetical protein
LEYVPENKYLEINEEKSKKVKANAHYRKVI